jgi:hypothetical protein
MRLLTDQTNEFSFFIDDLTVEVTLQMILLTIQTVQMSLLSFWIILQMRLLTGTVSPLIPLVSTNNMKLWSSIVISDWNFAIM